MMKQHIDLRSDTLTRPTDTMRKAMAEAPVGDDVYGEDPTINKLEAEAARVFHREAALFLPSGTMANQVAVHLHTRPGTEVVGEERSHVFNFEMGAMAALSGALPRLVHGEGGILEPAAVEAAIQPSVGYATETALVLLENSANLAGGRVTPAPRMLELSEVAHSHGLPVHLDGARIFNAAAFLGIEAWELARDCDTVMFCLSKGLAAPVGSMLVGDRKDIAHARRIRKLFGGGMRQAGILAAAGLIALEEMAPRAGEDNLRARRLAEQISSFRWIDLDPEDVETNIIYFHLRPEAPFSASRLKEMLKEDGLLVHSLGPDSIRMVVYYEIDDRDIAGAASILGKHLG